MAACRKTVHLGREIEMEWTNELALSGKDVAASHRAQGSIFFVGNATVILSYAGFTILTDPNFLHRGDHVHLGYGMTAACRTDPALEPERDTDKGRSRRNPEGGSLQTFPECARGRRGRESSPVSGMPRFFFALRKDQQACSRRCNSSRRVREWRANQTHYEYRRKLRGAGIETGKKRKRFTK
jgi:hypothetical protein